VNDRTLNQSLKILESVLIVSLIFLADNIDLEPAPRAAINAATYGVVIILGLTQWKKIGYILTKDLSLTLLILIAIASILWTVDLAITLENLKGLIRTVAFGAYIAIRYSLVEQRLIFTLVAVLSLVLNIVVLVAFPSFGIDPSSSLLWKGLYTFKQFLGRAMAFSISIFLVNLIDKKNNHWLSFGALILSIFFLLLSQSKTNLIVSMIFVLLLPLYKISKQRLPVRWTLLSITLVILTTIALLVASNFEFIVVDLLGKNLELNGRVPIWNLATQFLVQKPWLGYGYSAFWASDPGQMIIRNTWARGILYAVGEMKTFHAHNTFLETYLQLGLLGGGLLMLNVLLVLKRVYDLLRITGTVESFWMLQFLTFQLVYNMSETPTYLSPFNMYWIVYVSIAYSSALELHRIQRRPKAIPPIESTLTILDA
jgi:exopolysaccharide production protein ExoQ